MDWSSYTILHTFLDEWVFVLNDQQNNKIALQLGRTHADTSPRAWLSPCACVEPYHPVSMAAMESSARDTSKVYAVDEWGRRQWKMKIEQDDKELTTDHFHFYVLWVRRRQILVKAEPLSHSYWLPCYFNVGHIESNLYKAIFEIQSKTCLRFKRLYSRRGNYIDFGNTDGYV